MKNKNLMTGVLVSIIILLLCMNIMLVLFIYYDGNKKDNTVNNDSSESEIIKDEELDVNSTLIQNLYNLVAEDGENSYVDSSLWRYEDTEYMKDEIASIEKTYFINNMSEERKMMLLSKSLKDVKKLSNDELSKIGVQNINRDYKLLYNEDNTVDSYSKDEVLEIYKKLYGSEKSVNVQNLIFTDFTKFSTLIYNDKLNSYLLYQLNGGSGGTYFGPSYFTKLFKAVKNNEDLILYQNLDIVLDVYENEDLIESASDVLKDGKESYILKYTFKRDTTGNYVFL